MDEENDEPTNSTGNSAPERRRTTALDRDQIEALIALVIERIDNDVFAERVAQRIEATRYTFIGKWLTRFILLALGAWFLHAILRPEVFDAIFRAFTH